MDYLWLKSIVNTPGFVSLSALVALVSLIISIINNFRVNRANLIVHQKDFNADFFEIVRKISDISVKREELIKQSGNNWRLVTNTTRRVQISNEIDLLLGEANNLLSSNKVTPNDASLKIMANSLLYAGKITEAVKKFQWALKISSSDLDAAINRRALGKALIMNGDLEEGRGELFHCIKDFETLALRPEYNDSAMKIEIVETWQRLIEAELQIKVPKESLLEDLKIFKIHKSLVDDVSLRAQFDHAEIDLSILIENR